MPFIQGTNHAFMISTGSTSKIAQHSKQLLANEHLQMANPNLDMLNSKTKYFF